MLWVLPLSRAGALGHVLWGGKLFAAVVRQFLELLRQSDVVHADETGWRIDGKKFGPAPDAFSTIQRTTRRVTASDRLKARTACARLLARESEPLPGRRGWL